MNERLMTAFKNPCYRQKDSENKIYEKECFLDELKLITKVKVLAFVGNEIWNASAEIYSPDGTRITEETITDDQRNKVNEILKELLQDVGRSDITYFVDKDEFEAVRFLTPYERKKLPPANLAEIFKYYEMIDYALSHPNPTLDDMILRKYSHKTDFGGVHFNLVLTAVQRFGSAKWHASISITNEGQEIPMKIINDMPQVYFNFSMTLLKKILTNVGTGEFSTIKPDKDLAIINLYRDMSKEEIKSLPKNNDFILGKGSMKPLKSMWN